MGEPFTLALILKVGNPQGLENFRPIFLIGYVYNVISKVLAKWLKAVLGNIIDENQSALGRGGQGDKRYMLDSVLVANEVVDDAKRRKKTCLIFKVDCLWLCQVGIPVLQDEEDEV